MQGIHRLLGCILAAALVSFATIPNLTGCVGQRARQHVGVPALKVADDGVIANAREGVMLLSPEQQVAANADLDTFAMTLETGDVEAIKQEAIPRWTLVRSLAEASISSRLTNSEIGPGVAASLRERLARFEEVLLQVGTR